MFRKGIEFGTLKVGKGERKVLFILGWCIDFDLPETRWALERMGRCPWETTFVRIPLKVSDFEKDVIEPCRKVLSELEDPVLVGLSMGGLAASYLDTAPGRIFISPFWGFHPRRLTRLLSPVMPVIGRFHLPLLPRYFGHWAVGDQCPALAELYMPFLISCRWVREMHYAHLNLPKLRDDDVVLYCPKDRVVDPVVIREKGLDTIEFEGGHLFLCVKDREEVMDMVEALIRSAFRANRAGSPGGGKGALCYAVSGNRVAVTGS
ncbi:MAG: alpha/beta fold hydrolase [Thermoplasmatota archaeon]